MEDPEARLEEFIDRFAPGTAALARLLLARLKLRLPGAVLMVYDNYAALVIGFGAVEKPSRAILSLAIFPRHVSLYFIRGKDLRDPDKLLRGEGNQVRSLRLESAGTLDDPRVEALIANAVSRSEPPFDTEAPQRLVIRSVSTKQRPRR